MNKKKIIIICIISSVFLAFFFVLGILLLDYRASCLNTLFVQQQMDTNLMADALQVQGDLGADDSTLVDFVMKEINTSDSRYGILTRDNEILFVKDQITTKGVYQSVDECYSQIKQLDVMFTSSKFVVNDVNYEVCIVANKTSALYRLEIDTFYMYLIILVVGMGIFLFSYIIAITARNYKFQQKVIHYQQEMIEMTKKQDYLVNKMKLEKVKTKEILNEQQTERKFDLRTVYAFLRKSTSPKLFPMCIMIVKMYLGDKYYTKRQMIQFQQSIKEELSGQHVLCEIGKGEFCVLLYHTQLEQASSLRRKLMAKWRRDEEYKGYFIKSKVAQVDLELGNAEKVFEVLRSDVTNMLKKGSHGHAL